MKEGRKASAFGPQKQVTNMVRRHEDHATQHILLHYENYLPGGHLPVLGNLTFFLAFPWPPT